MRPIVTCKRVIGCSAAVVKNGRPLKLIKMPQGPRRAVAGERGFRWGKRARVARQARQAQLVNRTLQRIAGDALPDL